MTVDGDDDDDGMTDDDPFAFLICFKYILAVSKHILVASFPFLCRLFRASCNMS